MNSQQTREDEMTLEASRFYTGLYGEMVAEETGGGEKKARRRRRKGKGENGETSEAALARKRKLSNDQVKMLEENFGSEHKLESERKDKLASQLGLDPRQVAVWFQNRRARWKTKKLEEEYSKLKNSHDQLLLSKCHLESEVLKLKEKLDEAEKAMQQLSLERSDVISSNSPHSTLTVETMDQPFIGEFGVQGFVEDVYYEPENNYNNGMEWDNYNFYYM